VPQLLAQSEVANQHPVRRAVLSLLRYEDVLRLDVAMNDFEGVEMMEAGGNLRQCALWLEGRDDGGIIVWALDEVFKGGRTEFKRNVKEVGLVFLIIITDDVGMIVRFLEESNFAQSYSDKILKKTFNGYGSPLEGALVNNCSR
jgi:hypothetical protein